MGMAEHPIEWCIKFPPIPILVTIRNDDWGIGQGQIFSSYCPGANRLILETENERV
ncbi:hypothetical protein KDAU_07600 [Dictyobacter aurantiacus]|uniref:Uncharacterized protein n=1 Tax=Dictyobacter aurantiacus TaxID=1936993 RepID=A0A401Z989_9CHLR|nr:hypothetical protein KDAU_07600 [Dictyobacter aurantiacus]